MRVFAILFLLVACASGKPNVLFIFADDLGADSSPPYGCETISTPTIDSIATDGVRLNNMHSSTTCAPSRAMLLTGRLSVRNGVLYTSGGSNISSNEWGFTQTLSENNIKVGWFGKWNLWGSGNEFATQTDMLAYYGVDTEYTYTGNLPAYGDPSSNETYEPYITMTNVTDFIRDNKYEPFVCVWAARLPHRPYSGTPDDQTIYPSNLDNLQNYMTTLDGYVSNVLAVIEEEGLMDNTIIMWGGDNGTDNFVTNTFNGQQVSGGKGSSDENGTWVPFYVKWDGVIPAGGVESNIWSFVDISATILDFYGLTMPVDRIIDGRSFKSYLTSTNKLRREFVITTTDAAGSVKNDRTKAVESDGTFTMYDITDKPFGDILITDPTPTQEGDAVWLPPVYSNTYYKAYGDRPWGGSTNDYLLLETP